MSDVISDTKPTPKKWDARQTKFLHWLQRTGNVAESCRKAKVNRSLVYEWRNGDEVFAEAWNEALEIAIELLEAEARRRAEKGVLQPVYYLGKRVGSVRKYSDTLLIFLLKAHRPDRYRDNHRIEHTGAGGGPIETNSNTKVTVYLPDNGRGDRDSD